MNNNIEFKPDGFFKNGHFQTVYSALFHNPTELKNSEAVMIKTEENTTIGCEYNKAENAKNACTILIHGLEGSTESNYIVSTSKKLLAKGISVLRMNIRNCGGTMHLTNTFYNAGLTHDVNEIIKYCQEKLGHEKIYIVGYSLGANTVLKLAGESNYHQSLAGVVAVSPPLDLSMCANAIIRPDNKIYDLYYVRRMRRTYRNKKEFFPELVNLELLNKVRNLYDFDEYITGPLFNYKNAEDYYSQNSSLRFLVNIKVKTLIIQSKDDPIIPFKCTEEALKIENPNIQYLITEHGGHVGFINSLKSALKDHDRFWAENRIVDFITLN